MTEKYAEISAQACEMQERAESVRDTLVLMSIGYPLPDTGQLLTYLEMAFARIGDLAGMVSDLADHANALDSKPRP